MAPLARRQGERGPDKQPRKRPGQTSAPAAQLPTDPAEFDRVTKGWRWLARPVVKGYSKLLETGLGGLIEAEALDEEEKELGLQAVSASIYALGGLADWRVLCALFVTSTVAPRAAKRAIRRRQEKAQAPKVTEETVTRTLKEAQQKTGAVSPGDLAAQAVKA